MQVVRYAATAEAYWLNRNGTLVESRGSEVMGCLGWSEAYRWPIGTPLLVYLGPIPYAAGSFAPG